MGELQRDIQDAIGKLGQRFPSGGPGTLGSR
jgi:hypothetical protein